LGYYGVMETIERLGGRQRDPQTDIAAVEAVLDLVSTGATLSGLSLVAIAKHAGVSRNSLYRRWKTKGGRGSGRAIWVGSARSARAGRACGRHRAGSGAS
jgi:AcrR family transcriptional regulator